MKIMLKTMIPFRFFLCVLLSSVWVACSSGVDEAEFQKNFKEMSDNRLQFRKNMKALGDSSYAHREYARSILSEVMADKNLDTIFKPEYAAYNDSLRNELSRGDSYFHIQYKINKPLISQWEKREMDLDRLVERIKSGDVSAREGLDSIVAIKTSLKKLIHQSDSQVKISTDRYWEFRRTYADYQYNMRNLRSLYANEIYQIMKKRLKATN